MGSITSDRLDTYDRMLGGGRTYDFGQAAGFKVMETDAPHQGKLYKMVLRNGQPMGGVCATLCAFWIVFHAQQDLGRSSFTHGRSLWDYLFKDGGLNMGAAQNIVIEHHMSSGHQITYLANFMQKFGVYRRAKTMTGGDLLTDVPMLLSYTTAMQCARAITAVNGYKTISLKPNADGSGGGHMVAAFCDGGDVLFMDPNFGEFWFPNRKTFTAWFTFYLGEGYKETYKSIILRTWVAK
jgi:hypothetical protein